MDSSHARSKTPASGTPDRRRWSSMIVSGESIVQINLDIDREGLCAHVMNEHGQTVLTCHALYQKPPLPFLALRFQGPWGKLLAHTVCGNLHYRADLELDQRTLIVATAQICRQQVRGQKPQRLSVTHR